MGGAERTVWTLSNNHGGLISVRETRLQCMEDFSVVSRALTVDGKFEIQRWNPVSGQPIGDSIKVGVSDVTQ